jgi:hypothetical protein
MVIIEILQAFAKTEGLVSFASGAIMKFIVYVAIGFCVLGVAGDLGISSAIILGVISILWIIVEVLIRIGFFDNYEAENPEPGVEKVED